MKTIRGMILVCIGCFVFAAVVLGQAASVGSLTDNPVYQKNCAKCHGKTAEGRHFGGPSLKAEKVTSASSEDLHTMINHGKGRMPAFEGKLNSQDIDTLVSQIKTLEKK